MIKTLSGLVALTIATAGLAPTLETDLAALQTDQVLSSLGISRNVFDCAMDVTSGLTTDELLALLESADAEPQTPQQAAVSACVAKDPFSWGNDLSPDQKMVAEMLKINQN